MFQSHTNAPIGVRAFAKRLPKIGNISLVGAVPTTGMCGLYSYDGPVDGFRFLDFLNEHLLPNLQPGNLVVRDNLRVHHIEAGTIVAMIETIKKAKSTVTTKKNKGIFLVVRNAL